MTAFPTYSTGTVSIAAGATTIVGAGSNWAGVNAASGDSIVVAGNTVMVQDVTDVTHLVIDAWPYTAVAAGTTYSLKKNSPLRFAGAQAMVDVSTLVGALNTDGFYVFVPSTATVPDPSYGNDGQYAFQASTGKLWQKSGGTWNFIGNYKALGTPAPYDNAHSYNLQDVATSAGSSYVWTNSTSGSGHPPPNVTYWALLASIGSTGATALTAVAPWATAINYVVGPPASYVSINGSSYSCLVPHTSGTFATDLAAGKWGLIASKGVDGTNGTNAPTYGGSSVTSLLIAIASKTFTGVSTSLAYLPGNYVRASSAANGANFMEGTVTAYSGGSLTLNVNKIGGSGTFADWNFAVAGAPGAGDMLSTNNGSDFTNVDTALVNLRGVSFGAAQSLTSTQKQVARSNMGSSVGVPDVIIEEQQPSGTNAGTASSGSWFSRNLNTLVFNAGTIPSFSLSGAVVTLSAGTYYFKWSVPGFSCNQFKSRLLNVTDSSQVAIGMSRLALATSSVDDISSGSCVVTIAATKTFALQQQVTTTQATNGQGVSCGFTAAVEVYARLEISKIG